MSGDRDAAAVSGLSRFLFLRPTLGLLIVAISTLGGALALTGMVKESTPDLEVPIATIETRWPGADPETIDREVTAEIEKELKSLDGLRKLRSASFSSFSVITVEFDPAIELSDAMARLREKIDDAESELPSDAEAPVVTQKSVTDTPVISLAIFGEVEPTLLGRTASRLQARLERVEGVNEVDLSGHREEIIRIRLLQARLAALGLSPATVRDRIQGENRDQPWDRFEGATISATMRLYGRFRSVEDLRDLPVARLATGRVVRLAEVAEVRRDLEREVSTVALSWKGAPYRASVDVGIKKIPGFDTLEVIERVRSAVDEQTSRPDWPHGLEVAFTADQSEAIDDDLSAVASNAWQAMVGVFLVLFVVLSWREALIAGLAIPVTFMLSLAIVWWLGHTLNQVVVVGLVLALGLLVDVFILMMEGMHEGIFGQRRSFDDAALATVRAYAAPAFAGQMTTILAMAPLLAIGGLAGKFIRIVPETAITTLVVSFVVALLCTVPLSRLLLAGVAGGKTQPTLVDRLTERLGRRLEAFTLRATVASRRHALAWVAGSFAILAVALAAGTSLPVEMFPKDDGRELGITVELPPDAPLVDAQRCATRLGEVLREQPYFQSVTRFAGAKSPMATPSVADALTPTRDTYLVGFSAYFVARGARERPAYAYVDELRSLLTPHLDACAGGTLVFTPRVGGTSSEDPIQVVVQADDLNLQRSIAREVVARLGRIDGAVDPRDTMGPARTDVKALPRREALDFHQLSLADVAYQIRVAMTDDVLGQFPQDGGDDDLDIRMGTAWPSRDGALGGPSSVQEAATLAVITRDGTSLPLFSLVDLEVGETPLVIGRDSGERAVTIKARTQGRTAGEVLAELRPWLEEQEAVWPEGVRFRFAGEAEEQAETFGDAGTMLGVALFLVLALLIVQFDSLRLPLVIIASVPLSLIGVLLSFYVGAVPISFPAMVGIIALVGIVVNNAIVMVDTIAAHARQGKGLREAAARGASDRLRPIFATTITTVVGLVPLALGDPFWMPLCLAIISGLVVSTASSLLVVPALYFVLASTDRNARLT